MSSGGSRTGVIGVAAPLSASMVVRVLAAVTVGYLAVPASWGNCLEPSLVDDYVGRELVLRRTVNDATLFYLNDAPGTYYHLKDARTYLYGFDQTVLITQIAPSAPDPLDEPGCGIVLIAFENDLLGPQEMKVSGQNGLPLSTEQIRRCIDAAFVPSTGDHIRAPYAIDDRGLIHSNLCDHLQTSGTTPLATLPPDPGPGLCSVCFPDRFLIPDYAVEKLIGTVAVQSYLESSVLLTDEASQHRLERIGRVALSRWRDPSRLWPLLENYDSFLESRLTLG